MSSRTVGLTIAAIGAMVVIVGALVATGALGWFGRLPGDIHIRGENARVFIPITSMLVVSVVLSLVLSVVRRFFG
jgi:hypothetical protein